MAEPRGIAGRAHYRAGTTSDLDEISSIEAKSYLRAGEGLSTALVTGPDDTLSFVAVLDSAIIGHVLLTRIEGPERTLALAPLAILPEWRDMQIGTSLVRHALDHARQAEWRAVFVYGQPDYYGRFGFRSDLADCAHTSMQGPRLMAFELVPGALAGWSGPLGFPDDYQRIVNAAQR